MDNKFCNKKRFKYSTTYYRKVKLYMDKFKTAKNGNSENKKQSPETNLGQALFSNRIDHTPNTSSNIIPIQNSKGNEENKSEIETDISLDDVRLFDEYPIVEEDLLSSQTLPFYEKLKDWALRNQITHSAVNELLLLLKDHGVKDLPVDSRKLLNTPRFVKTVPMGTGEYWHNGLRKSISNSFSCFRDPPKQIFLNFNMDGLPLYKSSKYQFWPILANVVDMRNISPMIIGIYYGKTKPPSAEEYLKLFVDELGDILQNGVELSDNFKLKVYINCFICDTPARSFIKGVVNFNHYHGCTKCSVIGEYSNEKHRMSFPRIDCSLRTDHSFRTRTDPDHHKENSPLERLCIDMIQDFPIADSLHLTELGIMKRCLIGWVQGKFGYNAKWSGTEIEKISKLLVKYNSSIPSEIHRAVRGLDCISFWKAVEFRTFLLYIGPVILRDFLSTDVYYHFLCLFCAITICSSKTYSGYLDIANELIREYIELYITLYGVDSIGSNVHNLCHIIDDVKRFGSLHNISAYPFENTLGHIKSLLRNGNRPLAQAAKRIGEISSMKSDAIINRNFPFVDKKNCIKFSPKNDTFDKLYLAEGIILKNNNKDKWFLTKDNQIVAMIYATYSEKKLLVYGKANNNKRDFFHHPFDSSRINIYVSTESESNSTKLYNLNDIKCKLLALSYHNDTVFIPLIHSLDSLHSLESVSLSNIRKT